ncbi:MAG: GldM family protein [Bacteroidia bacterium]
MKYLVALFTLAFSYSIVMAQTNGEWVMHETVMPNTQPEVKIRFDKQLNAGLITLEELQASEYLTVVVDTANPDQQLEVKGFVMITESVDGNSAFFKMNSANLGDTFKSMLTELTSGSKIIITEVIYQNEEGEEVTIAEGSGTSILVIN